MRHPLSHPHTIIIPQFSVDEVKKELLREIETMSALDHPNILRLLGISEGVYVLLLKLYVLLSISTVYSPVCSHTFSL